MAKAVKRSKERLGGKAENLPLGKRNFMIIGLGILVIAAGYLAMSEGSVEGFLPITLAPILLVIGYCVVIPLGILYRDGMFVRRKAEGSSPTVAG
jgi:hypothetical protein